MDSALEKFTYLALNPGVVEGVKTRATQALAVLKGLQAAKENTVQKTRQQNKIAKVP